MYVHKRCALKEQELDYKRKVHGYCGVCDNQGTVYHVIGTEDSYKTKVQGVTEWHTYVHFGTGNTTITPSETVVEAESVEENEAIAEVAETALEEILDEIVEEEEEPDRTELEAESEDLTTNDAKPLEATADQSTDDAKAPLEAVTEASEEESIKETIDVLESIESGETSKELLIDPKADVKAEIARLEAELEKLQK